MRFFVDVTNIVTGWHNRSIVNNGIMIRVESYTGTAGYIDSFDHSTSEVSSGSGNRPRLYVIYKKTEAVAGGSAGGGVGGGMGLGSGIQK
jgi:hypothetical protein